MGFIFLFGAIIFIILLAIKVGNDESPSDLELAKIFHQEIDKFFQSDEFKELESQYNLENEWQIVDKWSNRDNYFLLLENLATNAVHSKLVSVEKYFSVKINDTIIVCPFSNKWKNLYRDFLFERCLEKIKAENVKYGSIAYAKKIFDRVLEKYQQT